MKFIKFASSAHLNFLNIALYDAGEEHVIAKVEHVVNGKCLGVARRAAEYFEYDLSLSELCREMDLICGCG